MKLQHVYMGSAAFAASMYSGYMYAKPMKSVPQAAAGAADAAPGRCAFDRLAGVYDDIIGSEERYMFYGLLRWWLLRHAQGDVLEISAGTGRNLPHYSYAQLSSLTLTDISQAMLQQARNKYFDELQLQYKQPDVSVKFMLADAEHLVAPDGTAPQTVLLPHSSRSLNDSSSSSTAGWRARRQGSSSSSSSSSSTVCVEESRNQEQPGSIWRFKQQQQQQQQQQASGTDAVPADGPAAASSSSSGSSMEQPAENAEAGSAAAADSSFKAAERVPGSWWRKAPQPCSCTGKLAADASNNSNMHGVSSSSSTYAPGRFDVVVDTFGLCSCTDAVQVLRQACQLLKPGGKLLLLEHGRSSWGWLNAHMDEAAARHYRQYGCWYNRDILDIVRQAGLLVESSSRWHFGTSYMIVATAPRATEQLNE